MAGNKFNSSREYLAKLQHRVELLKKSELVGKAALTIVSDQAKRIFEEGKATRNDQIGDYNDTKPIYVNPDSSPIKFAPKGKRGKPTRYGYFDSYKDFRSKIGRQTQFVDLKLVGTLASDFRNGLHQVSKNKWERTFKRGESKAKAAANQERFKKSIWKASDKEREKFKELVRKEVNKIMTT